MKDTQIKKVVLEVEGKEIVLSVDGAKKLKELLNDLFGKEVIKEVKIYKEVPYWKYEPVFYTTYESKFAKDQILCMASEYSTGKMSYANETLTCSIT